MTVKLQLVLINVIIISIFEH